MSKTHYKQLINPDYFGAYCIPEGEDLNVQIVSVQAEECTVDKGKKEVLVVARLVNQKPFILNATNNKSIAKLYGPYVEDWSGKTITVYATTTKLGKDDVECVRVRHSVAEKKKQTITNERLDAAIQNIKSGAYTVEKLNKNFVLNAEQTAKLNAALEVSNAPN